MRDGTLNLDSILVDNPVSFEHESSNVHDPDAIKVWDKATHQFLGYVPREQTPILHEAWAKGQDFTGKVTARSMDVSKGKAVIIQARLV